jgi:DNA-binding CsgD family transcriptional regulator
MDSVLCPVLVGRNTELAELTRALDSAAAGRGGAVFITGEEGVGKSRLAKALCEQATERGMTVMTGRGTSSSVPVPYRPVAEALMGAARGGLVPGMPLMSNYRAALGSLVPEWSHPGDAKAHVSPVIIGEALLRLLSQASRNGGLLMLEDLHFADPETLAIVDYLVDSLAGTSVLLVLTLRDNIPSAGLDLYRAATARRTATTVDVSRLSPVAVRKMAAACLTAPELPTQVSALLRVCDGLPFAVEEVMAAAVASGELARDDSGWHVNGDISTRVPDSIAGSVRSRLASLGPAASSVIVSAAVLGRQFDWTLLPRVAGVPEAAALEALEHACRVQLVEPAAADSGTTTFRFRHSLTRDAILADLMVPELVCRAAAGAAAIVQSHPGLPGNWCELAAELYVLACQPHAAARLLVTSARRDLLKGAVSSAVTALRNARKLLAESALSEPKLGIEVDEVMLEAFAQAGDSEQIAPLADDLIIRLARADADPRRQALVRLRAASTRPEDTPAAAARHLAAAAAIADQLRDSELASRIEAVGARNALGAGELDKAEQLGRRALATAEAAGLTGWAAEVALESLEVIGRSERMRDLAAASRTFERLKQIADSGELGIWRIRARHELSTVEMLRAGSASELREVRQLAADAGATCVGTVIALQLGNLASLGTDLEEAMELARSCQKSAAQISAPRIQAMATCVEANIWAVRADRERMEEAAARAEAVLPGDPEILVTTWGQARVLAALFRDDLTRALANDAVAASHATEALASPRLVQGFYSALQAPMLAPRRAIALHALLAAVSTGLGDGDGGMNGAGGNGTGADGGARAAIEQATRTGAATSWNAGCLAYAEAVLAGRAGDRARASALADDGARQFGQFAPWWNNLARRLVAASALRDGWGSPVSWLREAASSFESTGHDQLASACRGVLRRAGERVPRSGRGSAAVPAQLRRLGVTSREMDIFLLVGQGASNAEIGTKLYISPKTVQTHVASLILKTGTACRRELVAHAARLVPS